LCLWVSMSLPEMFFFQFSFHVLTWEFQALIANEVLSSFSLSQS
jgi:hypothetical protein